MDELAMFGALVVSQGNSAATIVTTDQVLHDQDSPAQEFTVEERQSSDAAFATHRPDAEPSPAATLLVVSAGMVALKGVVIDESRSERDEEEDDDAAPKKNENEKDRQ